MSKNRTWVNQRVHGFNPMGKPRDEGPKRPFDKQSGGGEDRRSNFDKLTLRLLNLYLEKKWNAEARMLDLSGLVDAEDLAELSPSLNKWSFCEKLALCIKNGKAWCQALDSINLSHNGITTLRHIAQSFVESDIRLLNLSLSSNAVNELSEVDHLDRLKLREVMLSNNPIARRGDEYHRYVVKKLRTIELLDTVPVKEWRKQLLPKLPDPRDSQMTTEANGAMVFQMCRMYFKCIDESNFDAVLDAYDNEAMFTQVSDSTRSIVYQHPQSKMYHQNLTAKSHNIRFLADKGQGSKESTRFVFRGRPAIIEFLRKDVYGRIKTVHDVSRFKADAIIMGSTVVATVHGSYEYKVDADKNTVYKRCFDRVFLLKPNKAGTEWPARIANDMLTIRESEEFPIVLPEPDIKAKLMLATGLNDAFASLLLKESNNNYEQALMLFNQNKAQGMIPAEAFAVAPVG